MRAALAALVMAAGGCGVRPNNLRSPSAAPAGVPASPAAPVLPPGAATTGPERSTTNRGLPELEEVGTQDAGH